MLEYVFIAALLVVAYLVLQNGDLKTRKWFLYMNLAIIVAAIIFLVIDSQAPLTFKKVVILMLVLSGIICTFIKRICGLRSPAKRQGGIARKG